jgi:hypothetical protein
MRESGVWIYGLVNLSHILGVAMLFGAVLVLDLRLVGLWRSVPLAALSRPAVTLAAIGFCLALPSGMAMFATKAVDYVNNPFLFIKFPAIALALGNVLWLHRSPAWRAHGRRELEPAEQRRLAIGGGLSLVFWLTAITAGRMIAYW